MAWQTINAFIALISVTNTLLGLLVLLVATLVASSTRGSQKARTFCSRLAEPQDEAQPLPELRRKATTAALGLGFALTASLALFTAAAWPASYDRSAYRARQAAPADASRSLRIEAARTGLYVGGLIRTNACDAHLLGHEFTSVTLENDLKWAFLSTDRKSVTEYNFTTADALIAQAQGANVRVRGHVLIWDTRPQSMPSGLSAAVTSTETARAVMKAHIDTMAAHFGDRVHVFDVVNEPTLGQ